jgi:hypothetical protein
MKLNSTSFDRINFFGQPFHGLWKAGSITLPNAETKAFSASPANGSCVLIKVPGQAEVTRSVEDIAADEEAGREWRNYGLISGGRFGDSGALWLSNAAIVLYIDSTKKRWLVRFNYNVSTSGKFYMRVRRFGHIDGTTHGWSDPYEITFPTEIWSAIGISNYFTTHSQNSTGSDSVIGTKDSMLNVFISGNVDLGAAGYGISITYDLVEYPNRLCLERSTRTTVSGVFTETDISPYWQQDNSTALPTGVTYDRTKVYVDGTLTEDNGAPTPVSGFTWVPGQQYFSITSTKTRTIYVVFVEGTKYISAGYHNDVLTLTGIKWKQTATEVETWTPDSTDHTQPIGLDGYSVINSSDSLASKIGSVLIHEQSVAASPANYGPWHPYDGTTPLPSYMLDGYDNTSTSVPVSWESIDPTTPWEYFVESGIDYYKSTYLIPLTESNNGWRNPVVALINRVRQFGFGPTYDVYTTVSVHAPSLATESTSTALGSLRASWHPVTNQLAVDTQSICWF